MVSPILRVDVYEVDSNNNQVPTLVASAATAEEFHTALPDLYTASKGDSEPDVIRHLMNSRGMSRLKGVLQGGIASMLGEGRICSAAYTRFEHCVGVMELIRHLGGDIKEQLAGLLHDVSHTAFSHVADYIFDCDVATGESYHELSKEKYWRNSDLIEVLSKYGYCWETISDDQSFSLLEQDAPALCADRVDYFFRDGFTFGLISREEIRKTVDCLAVHNGAIVVTSVETARWMFDTYLRLDGDVYRSPQTIAQYVELSRLVKTALARNLLHTHDLIQFGDRELWRRLRKAVPDEFASSIFGRDNIEFSVVASREVASKDAIAVFSSVSRVRFIDPAVLRDDGSVATLSTLDEEVGVILAQRRCRGLRPCFIEAVPARRSMPRQQNSICPT